jgi:MerR family transcriptional regulator, redox-sensitive transcriptional activator SoxR
MSDRLLTIGELAKRTGVAASALRYYEDLGFAAAARQSLVNAAIAPPRWRASD